jgi:hypothetical protein
MKGWVIKLLVVVLCLCMAAPVLAADQGENVWAKYNMKLYGRVKVDYKYLTGRSDSTTVATNIVDKIDSPDYQNDSTNFTARDTRFGFIASHEAGDWVGKGRFEMDMFGAATGTSSSPRFRIGYVDLANKDWGTSFRAGKDWNAIMPMNASTIDFGILLRAGNLWERPEQFTIRQKLADGSLELLLSAYKFMSGTSTGSGTSDETRMPKVGARAAYTFELFGGKQLVAVDGFFQSDKDDGTKDDVDRWLVGGEFKFNLGPVLLKGEVWYGEGIDGEHGRPGAIATQSVGTTTDEVEAWGGWVDATYKIMPTWSITAGVGIDDPEEDDWKVSGIRNHMGDSEFSQNIQAYLNTWYSITPAIKVGAEWMYVDTERVQGDGDPNPGQDYSKDYNQVLASVFYNF